MILVFHMSSHRRRLLWLHINSGASVRMVTKKPKGSKIDFLYNIIEYPTPVGEVEYTCGDV